MPKKPSEKISPGSVADPSPAPGLLTLAGVRRGATPSVYRVHSPATPKGIYPCGEKASQVKFWNHDPAHVTCPVCKMGATLKARLGREDFTPLQLRMVYYVEKIWSTKGRGCSRPEIAKSIKAHKQSVLAMHQVLRLKKALALAPVRVLCVVPYREKP